MQREFSSRIFAARVAAVLVVALAGHLPAVTAAPLSSHPDEAPPGIDLRDRPSTDELAERRYGAGKKPVRAQFSAAGTATAAGADSIDCLGDGVDGKRVQAIYAHASNVPDRYTEVAGLIAQYAADVDYQINRSAALSGKGRRVRYVTHNCALDVEHVTLTTSGDNSFSATRNELRARGYDRSDRKYLVWVDAAVGICGIAELYGDDRDTASNWNNSGAMFARVDAPCWGYAETHELLHTIGAVQDSAPHSTGAGHCADEYDTMCYSDGSGVPMSIRCPGLPAWHVDCNLDDYFNASPAGGSYLDTHWNAADSAFLEGSNPLPAPPTISLTAPSSFYAGNAAGVSATVAVPEGRTSTITWTTTKSGCSFSPATGASSVFFCPATATGSGQITATVVDSLGMSAATSKTFTLVKTSGRRVATGVSRSLPTIKKGGKAILTGRAVDAITGKPIIGLRMTIYYRRVGSTTWKKITTRTTGVSGAITYTVSPPKSTYYKVVTSATATWAKDWSSKKKLGVI